MLRLSKKRKRGNGVNALQARTVREFGDAGGEPWEALHVASNACCLPIGASPMQWAANSELKRTRGIRLYLTRSIAMVSKVVVAMWFLLGALDVSVTNVKQAWVDGGSYCDRLNAAKCIFIEFVAHCIEEFVVQTKTVLRQSLQERAAWLPCRATPQRCSC